MVGGVFGYSKVWVGGGTETVVFGKFLYFLYLERFI